MSIILINCPKCKKITLATISQKTGIAICWKCEGAYQVEKDVKQG